MDLSRQSLNDVADHGVSTEGLRLQSLNHYSDFGGTSESEASEISIMFPYVPRIKQKKAPQSAEGRVRQQRGSRAMRRYENDAYLTSLVMITEADGEYEADNYWPDKANEDTGFKCLFEDSSVRSIWDAFISLSETKQIALLSSLAYYQEVDENLHDDDDDDDDNVENDKDFDLAGIHLPKRLHGTNANTNNTRLHRGNRSLRRRQRGRNKNVPMHLNELPEAIEAFGTIQSVEQLRVNHEETEIDNTIEYISDMEETVPLAGLISVKLKTFIRKSALQLQRPEACRKKKHASFTVQDLCLMQRVEEELKQAFTFSALSPSSSNPRKPVTWTPSTSLLTPTGEGIPPSKGQPLVLTGFHRMLVHSVAAYLGLFSYSSWNDAFNDRRLCVDDRNASFAVQDENFIGAIRNVMVKQKISSS